MVMRSLVIISALLVAACSPDAERHQETPAVGPKVTAVKELMAAFNDHDADKMRTYWHDDVTWVEINGVDSSIVTNSADALYQELVAYFQNYPSVSSSLEDIAVNGNYLTAVERPVWEQDGERKSQSSVVVYEFAEGKIKRFWYFPPQSGDVSQ